MPKKPKLPGAADFFALDEAETEAPPEANQQPTAKSHQRTTRPSTRPSKPLPEPPPQPSEAPQFSPPATIPQGATEKVTFYLQPLLLKRLQLLKAQLLMDHNLKVSRSQIVELLLQEGLDSTNTLIKNLLLLAE